MLVRLLRTHLRPYRRLLLTLLGLQAIQAIASLYLPYINADVIDKGVMRGDTGYIWRTGGLMLAVTVVQLVFAVLSVYLGSRAAMG
ncbi:MAG TPA: ABC transporter ATP-binding protein, partial [Acidimicrobiia bacterium]